MATLSAFTTMTKSPPSTLGVNVGLCLPRSRVAAATASRPSTTSVASMTYHVRVMSPAFGVYVGTVLTSAYLSTSGITPGSDPVSPGAGQASTAGFLLYSATDTDPSPLLLCSLWRTARQTSSLPGRVIAGQNRCDRQSNLR